MHSNPSSIPNVEQSLKNKKTSVIKQDTTYGKFDKEGKNYTLTTTTPPRHWLNLHFSGPQDNEYYSYCSNFGTGQIVSRDKEGVKCTLIREFHKIIFLRDDDAHSSWNIGQFPLNTPVKGYRCLYTPSSTTLSSSFRGIQASQRVFVPLKATHEFWTLNLKNTSDRTRSLSIFAHAEFMLWGFPAPGSYHGPINHRAYYNNWRWILGHDNASCLQSIHDRHLNVHCNEIRL